MARKEFFYKNLHVALKEYQYPLNISIHYSCFLYEYYTLFVKLQRTLAMEVSVHAHHIYTFDENVVLL